MEYDGTNYHGWQLQPLVATVQGEIEKALAYIFHQRIVVIGAGRTDRGVHARGQVFHMVVQWKHPPENLKKALNSVLPKDIAILDIEAVSDNFHARHLAFSKTYRYKILNQENRSPLKRLYFWEIPCPLDLAKLQDASGYLIGVHDFSSFGTPTSGNLSTVRRIFEAYWEREEDRNIISFTITGSGFLRFMVRSLVGTLVRVALGKITPTDFAEILESCDRSRAGPVAKPHGLSLDYVKYL